MLMTDDRKKKNRAGNSVPATPHDALFRALLESPDRAAALIRGYLPAEIASLISDTPPKLLDGTFVDEALRGSQSDRLFEVQLNVGKPALLFCLLEHKSEPSLRTPLQLLEYKVQIWRRWAGNRADRLRALPPIIPLVFYAGRQKWTVPASIFDMIDDDATIRPFVRSMKYILHDLGRIELDQLSEDDAVLAGLGALKYESARKIPFEVLRQILAALPDDDPAFEIATISYIYLRYQIRLETLKTALKAAKPQHWEALMGTIAETLTKQARQEGLLAGRAEGKAEGKAEGLTEGEAKSLTRLLERRFGPLPRKVRDRIVSAELRQIETWFDIAIDAPDLDTIFVADNQH